MLETATETEQVIIAMEREALDRWGHGDPSGFLEISAPDVVYFDPFQSRRLNGISELRALYESIRGLVRVPRFELIDPRVQASADMAVLTFNYVGDDSNGVTIRWNCTEVFRRHENTWRIVQTHWSVTQPNAAVPVDHTEHTHDESTPYPPGPPIAPAH